MLGQFGDGKQFEDDMAEHPLPAGFEDSAGERREEPLEGVILAYPDRVVRRRPRRPG